jgi:hypothetical protein
MFHVGSLKLAMVGMFTHRSQQTLKFKGEFSPSEPVAKQGSFLTKECDLRYLGRRKDTSCIRQHWKEKEDTTVDRMVNLIMGR